MSSALQFFWSDKWTKARTYTHAWAVANGLASGPWARQEKGQKIRDKEVWEGHMSMPVGVDTKRKHFSTVKESQNDKSTK